MPAGKHAAEPPGLHSTAWAGELGLQTFQYQFVDPAAPNFYSNAGNEAGAYLQFILDYYDCLPPVRLSTSKYAGFYQVSQAEGSCFVWIGELEQELLALRASHRHLARCGPAAHQSTRLVSDLASSTLDCAHLEPWYCQASPEASCLCRQWLSYMGTNMPSTA